jgi:hypothetical protein
MQAIPGWHDPETEQKKAMADYYRAKAESERAPSAPMGEADKFKALPKENQIQITKNAEKLASINNVGKAIKAVLPQLKDPNISTDQKQVLASSLAKTLNSPEGADAVGADEAARILAYLDYYPNTKKGFKFGPDINSFVQQLENTGKFTDQRAGLLKKDIDQLQGRTAKQPGGLLKAQPKMVKVSNGKQTLMVPDSDAEAAMSDGFQVVE